MHAPNSENPAAPATAESHASAPTTPPADAMLQSIGDAVLSTDVAGHVTYLNGAAERMTGWSRHEAEGRPLREVLPLVDAMTGLPARDPLALAVLLETAVGLTPNCVFRRRDGREVAIEDSAAPIRDAGGTVVGAVMVFRDVGAALQLSREMSFRAQHDALTGLPNRLLLHDRLSEALALGTRHDKHVAVCFLDVDGLKSVNDALGHSVGDGLLCSIAGRLKGAVRGSDTVSRFGGDEFVVVLSQVEAHADAVTIARKLLQSVASPHRIAGRQVTVAASLGLAISPEHGCDAAALITNADAAMYRAKRAGAGSYEVVNADEAPEWPGRRHRLPAFVARRSVTLKSRRPCEQASPG